MKLVDISGMEQTLKVEKFNKIKLLHKFIFNDVCDRNSRNRIRSFTGFSLDVTSKEFKDKVEFVKNEFAVNELVSVANTLCVDNSGTKEELALRLTNCLNDLNFLKQNLIIDENELEDDDLLEDAIKETQDSSSKSENTMSKQLPFQNTNEERSNCISNCTRSIMNNISFNDVEGFITPFAGTNYESIENWIENFEDVSSLLNLSELQKIIFGKRLMTGKAKLFLQSEIKLNSWQKFKQLLLEEFGSSCNSAELHEMLSQRKMHSDETLDEYYLKMKTLASKGHIEDVAIIKYIINGINEPVFKKSILYDCKNLNDFRSKLKLFETLKNDEEKYRVPKFRADQKPVQKFKNDVTIKDKKSDNAAGKGDSSYQNKRNNNCFICGSRTHLAKSCDNKDKGVKCFSCSSWGHRSFDCPEKNTQSAEKNTQSDVAVIDLPMDSKLSMSAKFNDLHVTSLIDTGCQASLMRKNIFDKMGIETLNPLSSTLSGFGRCQVKPLGYFKCNIEVDKLQCVADIYVVEDKTMSHEAIIGLNVLLQGETIINENGIIIKNKEQKSEEINLIDVLPINLCNENKINVDHSVPKHFKDNVQQLVSNYMPCKNRTTNIELKVCTKTNKSPEAVLCKMYESQKSEAENIYDSNVNHNTLISENSNLNKVDDLNVSNIKIGNIESNNLLNQENKCVLGSLNFDAFLNELKKLTKNGSFQKVLQVFKKWQKGTIEKKQCDQSDLQEMLKVLTECLNVVVDLNAEYSFNNLQDKCCSTDEIELCSITKLHKLKSELSTNSKFNDMHLRECRKQVKNLEKEKIDFTREKMISNQKIQKCEELHKNLGDLRINAKKQILKVQRENKKTYNPRRKKLRPYKVGDCVAIKRTQFGPHFKLNSLGPYDVTTIKGGKTYDVNKEGYQEGPQCSSSCTTFMKL